MRRMIASLALVIALFGIGPTVFPNPNCPKFSVPVRMSVPVPTVCIQSPA